MCSQGKFFFKIIQGKNGTIISSFNADQMCDPDRKFVTMPGEVSRRPRSSSKEAVKEVWAGNRRIQE